MNEIKRILNACKYSASGFAAAFRSEAAFRWDVLIFVVGTCVAFMLPIARIEAMLLVFSLVLILLMELANTAIETIIDRISKEAHPLSRKAKDIGSLLVFISFANAILVWVLILGKILEFWRSV